jgi:hypothetical protein
MPRFLPPLERTIRAAGLAEITSDWSSSKIINYEGYTRAQLYVNISAVTDTPSVIFAIQGYDHVADAYTTIAATAAQTGTGSILLTLGPGQSEVDDVDSGITSVNGFLPRQFKILADGSWGGTDGMTFTALLVLGA